MAGRSPRVRGSQPPANRRTTPSGSIPACAGQPTTELRCRVLCRVDPRVCGAAHLPTKLALSELGRSPRVRGSLVQSSPGRSRRGSIPACAGQPSAGSRVDQIDKVDPRVCGAAQRDGLSAHRAEGRSPRVRGSPCASRRARRSRGSIPACAGQPSRPGRDRDRPRVDPRVCGAADGRTRVDRAKLGRSPRVRGSLAPEKKKIAGLGSIPACAGQPKCRRHASWWIWVDPRVCGAAQPGRRRAAAPTGRSPRVRGSPERLLARLTAMGSIPACAGQPCASSTSAARTRVDPRVCGAAGREPTVIVTSGGRSPRVRGSRQRHAGLGSG